MNPFLSTPSTSGLEALTEKAKQDLAQRLSIPSHKINLVEAKEVVGLMEAPAVCSLTCCMLKY